MGGGNLNTQGQREVLGLEGGASEAEPFWTALRRSQTRRGLAYQLLSSALDDLLAAGVIGLRAGWCQARDLVGLAWIGQHPDRRCLRRCEAVTWRRHGASDRTAYPVRPPRFPESRAQVAAQMSSSG